MAVVKWKLKTATSLCIKSGTVSHWKQAESRDAKKRQVRAEFDFFKKDKSQDQESSLADFYFDACINGGALKVRYCIPASSVRGALRSYTLKRLVEKSAWKDIDLEKKEVGENADQQQADKRLRMQVALRKPGWRLIQNLFGLATDSADLELDEETVAGRLQVSVGELADLSPAAFESHLLAGDFKKGECKLGPSQGKMVITTRNPLDRITQAAKDGGLHSFMELTPDNSFEVILRIANPAPMDLGMVAFWELGFNSGLLRLGGLTSAGRGRLVVESARVSLFSRTPQDFFGLEPDRENNGDRLSALFDGYVIGDWATHKKTYLEKLRCVYDQYGKEVQDAHP
jgi:CRISPR/Cas system CSM-associated protein Csm3 (group 7 of RAMP superfamily)